MFSRPRLAGEDIHLHLFKIGVALLREEHLHRTNISRSVKSPECHLGHVCLVPKKCVSLRSAGTTDDPCVSTFADAINSLRSGLPSVGSRFGRPVALFR